MIRTQISFTQEQKTRLDRLAETTGLSISELIRRAIDSQYREQRDLERDLEAMRAAAGAWKDRDFNGEEYVDLVRSGKRLAYLEDLRAGRLDNE